MRRMQSEGEHDTAIETAASAAESLQPQGEARPPRPEGERGERSRDRGRGRRERGERGPREERAPREEPQHSESAPQRELGLSTPESASSQEASAAPQPAQLPAEPAHAAVTVVEKSLPVAVEPAPAPAYHAPVDAAPAPTHAPAPVQVPHISPADLERALKDSGLQLVQTRTDAKVDIAAGVGISYLRNGRAARRPPIWASRCRWSKRERKVESARRQRARGRAVPPEPAAASGQRGRRACSLPRAPRAKGEREATRYIPLRIVSSSPCAASSSMSSTRSKPSGPP